jgi:hypothetical protein
MIDIKKPVQDSNKDFSNVVTPFKLTINGLNSQTQPAIITRVRCENSNHCPGLRTGNVLIGVF